MVRHMMRKIKQVFGDKRLTTIFILMLILMAIPTNSVAGTGFWTSTNGPYGGVVSALAISPDGSTIYAGTAEGGNLYKSTDGGNTWIRTTLEVTGFSDNDYPSITASAVDPVSPEIVYVGFRISGIYKTSNGGNTWEFLGDYGNVKLIKVAPTNPNTIYAIVGGGLIRSRDEGNSWSQIDIEGGIFEAFGISPHNPNTIYIGQDSMNGISKSEDGGESWMKMNLNVRGIRVFAIDPTTPSVIYAAEYAGGPGRALYKSIDSGESWRKVADVPWINLKALVIDPQDSNNIYAASDGNGILKSSDGGSTWRLVHAGLFNKHVLAIAIHPVAPNIILVGTRWGGVFKIKTINGGVSWVESNYGLNNSLISSLAVAPTTPSTIYAGTPSGIFRSVDGKSWTQINSGLIITRDSLSISALEVNPKDPTVIYAATQDGVFKSTDGGEKWIEANFGLDGAIVRSFAIDPVTPNVIYAASGSTYGNDRSVLGLYKSVDGANSWRQINSAGPFHVVAVHPTLPDVVYASNVVKIFKSTDKGESWREVGPDEGAAAYAIVFNPVMPNVIFAPGQVYKNFSSTDGGETWERIGSAKGNIRSLVIHPTIPNVLYGGLRTGVSGDIDAGVFRSTDGGMTWLQINHGLTNTKITSMVFDPTTLTIYAGTEGSGVFAYTETESLLPTPIATLTISPNELDIVSSETRQFTVAAVDENNNPVSVEATDVTWNIIGGIGNIDNSGLFTAIRAGNGRITAILKSNTFPSDESSTVTVSPGSIVAMKISHDGVVVFSGQKQRFRVDFYDINDNRVEIREANTDWEVIDHQGSISPSGHDGIDFIGTLAGMGKIRATLKDDSSISDEIDFTVLGPAAPMLNAVDAPVPGNILTVKGTIKFQFATGIVYEVEAFVNGIFRGITTTDPDTGAFIFPDILLLEERNEITAKVKDLAGNVSDASTPLVIFLLLLSNTHSKPNLWYQNSRPAFQWRPIPEASGYYTILDQNPTTIPTSSTGDLVIGTEIDYPNTPDGTWYFHIAAELEHGVADSNALHVKVNIDTSPPVITSETHPNSVDWLQLSNVRLSWQVPHPESVRQYYYIIDSNPNTIPTTTSGVATTETTLTLSDFNDGEHYLHVVWEDQAGNIGTKAGHYGFLIDMTKPAPVTDLQVSPSGSDVVLTWIESVDTGSGIAYYQVFQSTEESVIGRNLVKDGTVTSGRYIDVGANEGIEYFYIIIPVDHAGNSQREGNLQASLSLLGPLTQIEFAVELPTELQVGKTIQLRLRGTDEEGKIGEISLKEVDWEITNGIGIVSETGEFTATTPGNGIIKAILKSNSEITTEILVTVVAGTTIVFNPAELIIPQESSGTVNIRIEHTTDLAGFEWTLTFNPQVLEVVDVTEGNFLKQDGGSTFTPEPEIDNENGIASFAAGRIALGGVDGNGVLAQIRFKAKKAGESQLTLTDVKLSDSNANEISVIINSGSVSVPKFPPWDVNLDGVVSIFDIVIVGQNFGQQPPRDTRADVNKDGKVDVFDLVLIGSHFGESTVMNRILH